MLSTPYRYGLVAIASLVTMTTCLAQEGFPLDGTWRGEWGNAADSANRVVLIMKWNGETIEGQINPGPRSIVFDSAVLHAASWTVVIEATGRDGEVISIEGQLGNIGSYNRTIEGTWTQDGDVYAFKIARE